MPGLLALLSLLGILGMGGGKKASASETTGADESDQEIITVTPDPEPEDEEVAETPDPEPEEEEIVVVALESVSDPFNQDTSNDPDPVVVDDTPEPEPVPKGEPQDETVEPAPDREVIDQSVEVMSGRVTSFELDEDMTEVKMMTQPAHGNVTVNANNTISIVMSDSEFVGDMSFEFEATYSNGETTTVAVNVTATEGLQDDGWGLGENYFLLETDEDDNTIIEYGDNHREVYVSGSEDALTLNDIAILEGIDDPSLITGNWLAQHEEYGGSEDMALDTEAGMLLWYGLTDRPSEGSSDWLLFERGYEYVDTGRLIGRGAEGESELHPQYIGAYGEGDRPVIAEDSVRMYQDHSQNIVIQNITFKGGFQAIWGDNLLLEDIEVTDEEMSIAGVDGFTIRDSDIHHVTADAPSSGGDLWGPASDRISGLYVTQSEGVLIEGNFFDHNGWEEGYDYDLSAEDGQPPSFYSHNVYIQNTNTDVTFVDNITMQGASFGAMIRSGGFIEDNLFLDNNAAVNSFGGNYSDAGYIGNYSLWNGNVVTSAGHKTVGSKEGGLSLGIGDFGHMSALVGNIVTHLADPDNLEEQADKTVWHSPLQNSAFAEGPVFDDTIVYNWTTGVQDDGAVKTGINIDGLDQGTLDQTTIQNFTAQLLGQETATIGDLADYLREQGNGAFDDTVDADLINSFFQAGFGLTPDLDMDAVTQTFVANDLGGGMRWDNRLNWDQDYLPEEGQDVDLNGAWVYYAGAGTNTIADFDMGSGGIFHIGAGKLSVDGEIETGENGGTINIHNAGQFWTEGFNDSDDLEINVDGGRFANTGHMHGDVTLTATDGQTLLGAGDALFDLTENSELNIVGSEAEVGFDGTAGTVAGLRMEEDAVMSFTADENGFSTIEEFRSGTYGDEVSDVESGVNLGDGTLSIDVAGLSGSNGTYSLMDIDTLIGSFGDIQVTGLNGQDANIVIDYTDGSVSLILTDGDGDISSEINGTQASEGNTSAELWDILTGDHGIYDETAPMVEDQEDFIFL